LPVGVALSPGEALLAGHAAKLEARVLVLGGGRAAGRRADDLPPYATDNPRRSDSAIPRAATGEDWMIEVVVWPNGAS
jgi:hypothetical protein